MLPTLSFHAYLNHHVNSLMVSFILFFCFFEEEALMLHTLLHFYLCCCSRSVLQLSKCSPGEQRGARIMFSIEQSPTGLTLAAFIRWWIPSKDCNRCSIPAIFSALTPPQTERKIIRDWIFRQVDDFLWFEGKKHRNYLWSFVGHFIFMFKISESAFYFVIFSLTQSILMRNN